MSKIKIYKTFHAYENYLDSFYLRNPNLKASSFEKQKMKLAYDSSPWIFSWFQNNTNEDVEIFETVHNCEYLQKSWVGVEKKFDNWQLQIVFEQVKKMQPNICIIYPPELFDENIIRELKKLVKHEMLIVGYDGMNRKKIELYNGYDIVLTCSDYISDYYSENGFKNYTLPFAFDEEVLKKININKKNLYKVSFSGSIFQNIHNDRYEFIKYLLKYKRVDISTSFGINENNSLFSKQHLKKLFHDRNISDYFTQAKISRYNKGPLFGLEMFQFLKDSEISLNMHGDKINFAANVRLYEATGVGSCLLTDWKKNISDIFLPDIEVLTYSSKEEALEKIRFYQRNKSKLAAIAKKGQLRTLSCYTYKRAIPNVINFLVESYN